MQLPRCDSTFTVSFILAVMVISGCTTTRYIPAGDVTDGSLVLQKGDEVTLVLTDGRRFNGAIAAIDKSVITLIIPEQESARIVALSDVSFVEGRRFSAGKTGGLVATVLLVSLVLALGASGGPVFSPGL